MKALHITNGDCAVAALRHAGVRGEFLPWRDFLHEGPVCYDSDLAALSRQRAGFISNLLPESGSFEQVHQSFIERDEHYARLAQYDCVFLWFEHDLYDQLQLLQVVAYLAAPIIKHNKVHLCQSDDYLTSLSQAQLVQLQAQAVPLNERQYRLALRAWRAFCDSSPQNWQGLLDDDISALPYLRASVLRLLAQYPNYPHGLCRVTYNALKILAKGPCDKAQLFDDYQQGETARFLADSVFFALLQPLLALGLIAARGQHYAITAKGRRRIDENNNILHTPCGKRWIGGVDLSHNDTPYFDSRTQRLIWDPSS